MILVPWTGKRALTLVSLAGCAASALLLGGYAYALLQEEGVRLVGTWAPLALLITLSFCHGFGIGPVPWMMLSEVFPFRTRGLGSGVAAAMSYVLGFVASKSFLWLQLNLGRSGVFWLYGALSVLGVALLGWKMPETEGKSLAEIENFYKRRRSIRQVLANVTAVTEAPVLIGSKHRVPPEDETCLGAETLTSVATADNKLSESSEPLCDGKRKSVSAPSLVHDALSPLHNSASTDTVDTTASVETLQTSVDTIPNTDSKHFKTSLNVELSPPKNNINKDKNNHVLS
ncbi:facilitated trehalose transporter Tret1-2 homolog [Anabrus simplex]|uniref:facilitated trehalose transporter Tret1-2 homolog n=1 Tax=Anabrus simplex TaxID=316456 RepID=UPI0035A27662